MYRLDLSRYSARFDPHNISSKNNSSISSFINIPSNKNKQGDSEIEIERYPRTSKNKIKHIIKNFKHTRLRIWKIWKALRPSGGRVPPAATCGRSPASPPHAAMVRPPATPPRPWRGRPAARTPACRHGKAAFTPPPPPSAATGC
ncbi:Os08g0174200 [Oryza sativa Japonica Group]|uniref:Os08g0174200 protein n=1 Tax=Oryza sativa subsp. japonica TaxID=39947 RepID=A0A0P0XCF7_ORYSJ|nr:Os08g0174200 [Oryza sativa Japonica Group]